MRVIFFLGLMQFHLKVQHLLSCSFESSTTAGLTIILICLFFRWVGPTTPSKTTGTRRCAASTKPRWVPTIWSATTIACLDFVVAVANRAVAAALSLTQSSGCLNTLVSVQIPWCPRHHRENPSPTMKCNTTWSLSTNRRLSSPSSSCYLSNLQ